MREESTSTAVGLGEDVAYRRRDRRREQDGTEHDGALGLAVTAKSRSRIAVTAPCSASRGRFICILLGCARNASGSRVVGNAHSSKTADQHLVTGGLR